MTPFAKDKLEKDSVFHYLLREGLLPKKLDDRCSLLMKILAVGAAAWGRNTFQR